MSSSTILHCRVRQVKIVTFVVYFYTFRRVFFAARLSEQRMSMWVKFMRFN